MRNPNPKVGFVSIATPTLDLESARQETDAAARNLRAAGAQVAAPRGLVISPEQAEAAAAQLVKGGIDLLVIFLGTWAGDWLSISLVERLGRGPSLSRGLPFVLWATPEPIPEGRLIGCGLVGLVQTGGALAKLGHVFEPCYGPSDSQEIIALILKKTRASAAAQALHHARIGQIGAPCPGMSDAAFNQLALRGSVGPQVITLDLSDFLSRREKIQPEGVAEVVQQMRASTNSIEGPGPGDLADAARSYLALAAMAKEEALDALAFRCWPELRLQGVPSPCFALGRLSDEHIPSACEGDATAAASMLLLQLLTGSPAHLGDLLYLDEAENCAYEFHCGAAAARLAAAPGAFSLAMHAQLAVDTWKPGVTVNFAVAPGRVTYARLGEVKGEYRLVFFGGEALPVNRFLPGSVAKVRWDSPVKQTLREMIAEGHEHHLIWAYGDVRTELEEFCRLTGIRPVALSRADS